MWKTLADDCQFFDIFWTFALSFVVFNFYFCVTALGEKAIDFKVLISYILPVITLIKKH